VVLRLILFSAVQPALLACFSLTPTATWPPESVSSLDDNDPEQKSSPSETETESDSEPEVFLHDRDPLITDRQDELVWYYETFGGIIGLAHSVKEIALYEQEDDKQHGLG